MVSNFLSQLGDDSLGRSISFLLSCRSCRPNAPFAELVRRPEPASWNADRGHAAGAWRVTGIVRCCSLAECSIIACGQASYTEPLMANEALINLLDWCKRERENLQCQFDALKAGRFKTHSNDGSGWKDTTQDSIERVEENIRELSKLIYKYEAARFER
jgi:hypothetical protein